MSHIQQITIYDLAKQLELSAATISRALNNHPAISASTKKKVFELAEKLGYRTNTLASNLRKQRTNTIGVIVQRLNSYFLASALAGIEKVANEAGYNVIISQSLENVHNEIKNAETMLRNRVDGLIVSLAGDTETLNHFQVFLEKEIPVAFFDRGFEDSRFINVVINNFKYSYQITKHLIDQGCKRIFHVGGNQTRNIYQERLQGYRQAITDASLTAGDDMIIINDLTEEAGVATGNKILEMEIKPDGIFFAADICAASCMSVLKQKGIRIPEDIAIAGFNNDPFSRMTDPQLTTVYNPGYQLGETVAINLIKHLNGNSGIKESNKITLDAALIIRSSTLKKPESL